MKAGRLISWLLAAALCGSLAACGGTEAEAPADSGESPGATEAAQPAAAGDADTTITMITTLNKDNMDSDPVVRTFYESVERVQAAHPEFTFDLEYIPHDAYQEKAQILAAGNELPDIIEMKGSWTRNWVENGRVMKLNDMIAADPDWGGTLLGGASSAFTLDGDIYGLSIDGGGITSIVHYNTKIFEECGIPEFPKSIEEFNDAIVKIKDKGYIPISLGNVANWPAESCIYSLMMSRVCGEKWIQDLLKHDGSADFTNPKFVESLDVLKTWADLGAFNSDVNSIDYHQARVSYFEGKAAMSIDGFWAVNSIIKDAPQEIQDATKLAMIPIDPPAGDIEIYEGGGWALSVNSKVDPDSPKMAVIADWYKAQFSEEAANLMYEMGKIPSIKAGEYDKSQLHQLQQQYYDLYDKTRQYTVIDLHFSPSLVDVLNTSLQELLIDEITSEEIATLVQAEYEKDQ